MVKLLTLLALVFVLLTTIDAKANTAQITLTERNSIRFNDAFTDTYVAKIQQEIISKVSKLDKDEPLYLVLDTPGGSVFAGNLLITTIQSINHPVHTITVFAASMGYQLVQNLGERYILRSGVLMSHRASGGMGGQFYGELESRVQMIKDVIDQLDEHAAERTKVSIESYRASIQNELWAVGKKAVATNQADGIAKVTCDKSLRGTTTEHVQTIFGKVGLVFSKCPIITAPLDIQLSREVKDRASEDEDFNDSLQQFINTYMQERFSVKEKARLTL